MSKKKTLGDINNDSALIEGDTFPIVTLKNGEKVQTGTVAGVIVNIALYNAGKRGEVEEALTLAVPTLITAGLFKIFSPEEWIKGDNKGRAFIGRLAKSF